ncbi:hypothetical protein [Aliarcobacter cryaerophilus]|jgi:hypothetical protein|uniref:hypothetical protein n=1 Tax=Aliarcobacter cryaerophilus TaxID=28198 RepID=UPI0013DDBEDC|nr:hypothetical protein [Aliarcobacter cryaerophilus]
MYSSRPSYVFGFHGLDETIGLKILNNETSFKHSNNDYDWLADGIYFWENNYQRAKDYAVEARKRNPAKIKKPFVLGTILDLKNCLDLLDQKNIDFLHEVYRLLKQDFKAEGISLPKNKPFGKKDFDFMNRQLDCSVIRYAHQIAKERGIFFDSVRAAFLEGRKLYPHAGFRKHNHIQIAILNPNCIKGVFLPRSEVSYP